MKEGLYYEETMSPEERRRYLEQRLREVIPYAYRNAPAVKERFDQAGIDPNQIRTLEDLEKIPVLKKEDLGSLQRARPIFGGLVAVPIEETRRIFTAPGPLYHPLPDEEHIEAEAMAFRSRGIKKGDIVLLTFALNFPVSREMEEIVVKIGAIPIPIGPGGTDTQVQVLHDTKATVYIGSLTFLTNIIKRAEEQGYDFRRDFNLRLVFTGGEILPVADRDRLEKFYGISVIDSYGINEGGGIAYSCEKWTGLHLLHDLIVEVVDPDTGKELKPGEVGEVVITRFSKTYTIIRLGVGDRSFYSDEPCPCGRTTPRLVQILGRVGEAVKVRAVLVYPKQVEKVMSLFSAISNFQAEVSRTERRDELTFKIELKDETIDKEALVESLKKESQDICRVRVDKVEFVPKGTIPAERKTLVDLRS